MGQTKTFSEYFYSEEALSEEQLNVRSQETNQLISFSADGRQRARLPVPPNTTLPSCLWSRRIFPSLPSSRLTIFYCNVSSPFLQLVHQWLDFTYSRSHAFRYGNQNKISAVTRIELATPALFIVDV